MAGLLLELQQKVFEILNAIDSHAISENDIEGIIRFMQQQLNIDVLDDFHKYTLENKIDFIKNKLNRPIRVCGMVKTKANPAADRFG